MQRSAAALHRAAGCTARGYESPNLSSLGLPKLGADVQALAHLLIAGFPLPVSAISYGFQITGGATAAIRCTANSGDRRDWPLLPPDCSRAQVEPRPHGTSLQAALRQRTAAEQILETGDCSLLPTGCSRTPVEPRPSGTSSCRHRYDSESRATRDPAPGQAITGRSHETGTWIHRPARPGPRHGKYSSLPGLGPRGHGPLAGSCRMAWHAFHGVRHAGHFLVRKPGEKNRMPYHAGRGKWPTGRPRPTESVLVSCESVHECCISGGVQCKL